MAATVGSIRNLGGVGGGVTMKLVTVTLDSSYDALGEALTANQCGLGSIQDLIPVGGASGYDASWDQANLKLLIWPQGGVVQTITKTVAIASMTDGGGTSGLIDFAANSLPIGAIPISSKFACSAAFSGDTTAVWQMGVSGSTSCFSANTTNSCFTAITTESLVTAATALTGTSAARTPRLTITTGADFTTPFTTGTAAGIASLTYMLPASSTLATGVEAGTALDLSAITIRCLVIGTP